MSKTTQPVRVVFLRGRGATTKREERWLRSSRPRPWCVPHPAMGTRLLAVIAAAVLSYAGGHVHQQVPVSRQYSRSLDFHDEEFKDWEKVPYAYNAGGVKMVQQRAKNETDPAVLAKHGEGGKFPLYYSDLAENGNYLEPEEIAVRKGVCGDPRLGHTKNTYSTPNSRWPVVAEYGSGHVIEIDMAVVYFHWGHVEFFVCDANDLDDPDGVVTQECLNKHPLTRAPYTGTGSPIDPSYPGRYYVDPPCRKDEVEQNISSNFVSDDFEAYSVKMSYVLPDIECEHCVLQMHYMTGNRCKHIGYDEFDPSSWDSECAPDKADWIPTDMGLCGVALSYPEEFWACSDIKLSTAPSASPTHSPTTIPSAAPTPDAEGIIGVDLSDSGAPRVDTIFSSLLAGAVVALAVVCSNAPGDHLRG